jgi:acetyl esterase/lipase
MQAAPSVNLPHILPLWPEGATPLPDTEDGEFPRFTLYLPSEEYRLPAAVLVLPGGGYGMVSTAKEGHRPAQWLNAHGIAAAVLEYRHAPRTYPVPLLDARRGLRLLRQCLAKAGIADAKTGVLGFSAGGHLAGLSALAPDLEAELAGDAADALCGRPDFAALIYPVVSFTASCAHLGSRDNLLGKGGAPALAVALSLEQAVRPDSPPFFLAHAQDDAGVPVANSLLLFEALTAAKVSAALQVFPRGGHGFGLAANHAWGSLLLEWIQDLLKS